MHSLYTRKRIRAALAATGTTLVELAALTGKPLTGPESEFLRVPVRGPVIDKGDVVHAEALSAIAGHSLDVLRVLASHHPDALEAAIAIAREAKIAEATDATIGKIEDLEIAQVVSA